MGYRIELQMRDRRARAYDEYGYAENRRELITFLQECVDDEFQVAKIVRTTKDGKGYDVTNIYRKYIEK